jgi:hypothetical protein
MANHSVCDGGVNLGTSCCSSRWLSPSGVFFCVAHHTHVRKPKVCLDTTCCLDTKCMFAQRMHVRHSIIGWTSHAGVAPKSDMLSCLQWSLVWMRMCVRCVCSMRVFDVCVRCVCSMCVFDACVRFGRKKNRYYAFSSHWWRACWQYFTSTLLLRCITNTVAVTDTATSTTFGADLHSAT